MTVDHKEQVRQKLQKYVSGYQSQKQAAASLRDCSEATIINILNGKWADISDKMWQNVTNQLEKKTISTPVVETQNFMTLILYYSLAQENGATFAITAGAGFGKSFTGKWYAAAKRGQNVYYLECAELWNKKIFLANMLQAMGKPYAGLNVYELMQAIVFELRRQRFPLFILDEVDKLTDPVLKFFITLYNELDGVCGFVWTSTDNIEKRFKRGLNINKNGYQELFSRIGQRFISLPPASQDDITAICKVNNITDPEHVHAIINECGGDLRRVKRNFLKEKAKLRKNLKAA